MCFTGGDLWSWEVGVGPGQPLNYGVLLVACRGRQAHSQLHIDYNSQHPSLSVSINVWYMVGRCLPLQGGAWQVRVVISRGSLQFWAEPSGLEHTT